MSSREDEVMRILGKLEARADSTHEYVVAVSEKLARHVEDKDLHAKEGGVRLEVPHAVGASGLIALLGYVGHWLQSLFHSGPLQT